MTMLLLLMMMIKIAIGRCDDDGDNDFGGGRGVKKRLTLGVQGKQLPAIAQCMIRCNRESQWPPQLPRTVPVHPRRVHHLLRCHRYRVEGRSQWLRDRSRESDGDTAEESGQTCADSA